MLIVDTHTTLSLFFLTQVPRLPQTMTTHPSGQPLFDGLAGTSLSCSAGRSYQYWPPCSLSPFLVGLFFLQGKNVCSHRRSNPLLNFCSRRQFATAAKRKPTPVETHVCFETNVVASPQTTDLVACARMFVWSDRHRSSTIPVLCAVYIYLPFMICCRLPYGSVIRFLSCSKRYTPANATE